jgi:hypothetical protein
MVDACYVLKPCLRLRVIALGQAVDLVNAKDGVAFEERNLALGFFAGVNVKLGPADAVGVNDKAALLAVLSV